jgi:hypothetical protein
MSTVDPDYIARLIKELHGYEPDAAGAARCAGMLAAVAAIGLAARRPKL